MILPVKKTHFLTCVHNILDMIVNGIYIHNEKPHQINRHHQWNYQSYFHHHRHHHQNYRHRTHV